MPLYNPTEDLSEFVVGPASSTDNAVALFDGTTGKLIKDSPLLLDVSAISGGGTVTLKPTRAGSGNNTFILPDNFGTTGELVTTTGVQTIRDKILTNGFIDADSMQFKETVGGNGAIFQFDMSAMGANSFSFFTLLSSASASRNWTFPDASGTVVLDTMAQTLTNKTISGASNTITNVSLTTGVTGVLPVVNGGTGLSSTTINQLLYSSAANTISGLATGNNGVLVTSGGGVPSISSTLPNAVQDNITRLGTIVSGVWNGTTLAIANGGTGQTTANAALNALLPAQTSNAGKYLTTDGTNSSWGSIPTTVNALASNATANSTTTLVKITALDQVAAAGTYQFKYMVRYQSGATTTGVRFAVNHSGTVTAFVWNTIFADAGTAASATPDQDQIIATGAVLQVFASRAKSTTTRGTTLSVDTANADMLCVIEGMMIVTVSGNLELWHGSEVAAASTVMAGTSLVLIKVL